MSNLHEKIEHLLKERNITGYKMCTDLGMSRSFMTELRKGRSKSVTTETAQKIADYFGVSVDYLLGTENEKAPAETAEADDELLEMLEEVRRRPDLKILFSLSKKATPEDVQKSIKIIKAICGDDDGGNNN